MKISKRRKEWEILRALLFEGMDLETCSLIIEQSEEYLRKLIDDFAPLQLEDLY